MPEPVSTNKSTLTLPKRFANVVYTYPFVTLGIAGVGAAATIQRRILHSRVLTAVIAIWQYCNSCWHIYGGNTSLID